MNKKYAGLDFPAWFDGKDVNEAAFCREFLSKNKLIYADNAFFTPDGRLTDPLMLKEKIYAELECYAAKNIPRTISNIVEIMKLAAHTESFPPKPDEIHVQNGTLRTDGSFLAGRSEIVRSRFPIDYNPQAGKPVVWLRFLSDLLYPEDIPTFQEYIGYCLVPSAKGQRMMILKGEGGEGKSQIGPVLARLFGCNMKDGSIAKISDNRFARADLEHIHLLVDDDMKMEALKQTNYVKSIVTAQGKMDLERKSVQSYQGWMYPRLLAFSNGDLQSLYDRSNGFYRRQLILTTKEKLTIWEHPESPTGTKGALLYSPDGSMCALRGRQPRYLSITAVLRHFVPYKGVPPLRRLRVYPCPLCSGNNLLTQTISAAKSEQLFH